jgi:2'-5' RNA ligase
MRRSQSALQMRKRVTVYWLIPAEPERELFREIIRILAKQFDGPRFEPHLTLFTTAAAGQSPRNILERIDAKPIRLRVREIAFSSKFTKALFVRFVRTPALNDLNAKLRLAAKLPADVLRDPHVSLLYKKLPAAVKKELASTIRLPFREVVFDAIKTIHCASPTRTGNDVETWRAIATKSLRE